MLARRRWDVWNEVGWAAGKVNGAETYISPPAPVHTHIQKRWGLTGGEVAEAVLLLDDGRLRALARPGGACFVGWLGWGCIRVA